MDSVKPDLLEANRAMCHCLPEPDRRAGGIQVKQVIPAQSQGGTALMLSPD